MTEIATEVIALLARHARRAPESISADTSLDSLGLDSLALVEAIFSIEERFDILVPFNPNEPGEAQGFDVSTVGAICEGVTDLVRARDG